MYLARHFGEHVAEAARSYGASLRCIKCRTNTISALRAALFAARSQPAQSLNFDKLALLELVKILNFKGDKIFMSAFLNFVKFYNQPRMKS